MLSLWTDGSCLGNPGPGGWAVYRDNGPAITGGEKDTTNNRMELKAIIIALGDIPRDTAVIVWSDSRWAINIALGIWKAKKNLDLVKDVKNLLNWRTAPTYLKWVKAHDKSPQNNNADMLAYEEAKYYARV